MLSRPLHQSNFPFHWAAEKAALSEVAGSTLQSCIQRHERSIALESRREHHRIWKSKESVLRTQLRGAQRDRTIEGDNLHATVVHERVDNRGRSLLYRFDEDFSICARRQHEPVTRNQMGPQYFNGILVLCVKSVEERNNHARVERYRSHSFRSSSR
jgi:hypothetical protein